MNPPKNAKQVRAFLGLVGYYHKFIKNFTHIAKPLTAFTHHDAKFAWTSNHLTAFNTLKSTLLEAPILHYPDPSKCYIVYIDASDDACGTQLSQEHDGQELPVVFLSHTGSLWHLVCCDKTELLPRGIWHCCLQWKQAFTGISKW